MRRPQSGTSPGAPLPSEALLALRPFLLLQLRAAAAAAGGVAVLSVGPASSSAASSMSSSAESLSLSMVVTFGSYCKPALLDCSSTLCVKLCHMRRLKPMWGLESPHRKLPPKAQSSEFHGQGASPEALHPTTLIPQTRSSLKFMSLRVPRLSWEESEGRSYNSAPFLGTSCKV